MSKGGAGKAKGKRRGDAGVLSRNHAAHVRWAVDFDYLDQLSPEERRWLAEFSDRHYGADFRGDEEWTTPERRERYRAKYYSRVDVFSTPSLAYSGAVERDTPMTGQDVQETPEYLADPEYRAAVAQLRGLVDKKDKSVKGLARIQRAKRRLEEVVRELKGQ